MADAVAKRFRFPTPLAYSEPFRDRAYSNAIRCGLPDGMWMVRRHG